MVCEFADVFPKELPFLPPHKEMDFSIELYLGKENIQLNELQSKGLIGLVPHLRVLQYFL